MSNNNHSYPLTVKYLWTILLLIPPFAGHAQHPSDTIRSPFPAMDTLHTEIRLNKAIDTLKCGIWVNGDYRIYIEMEPFMAMLQKEYDGLIQAFQNTSKNDSAMLPLYQATAQRYRNAIDQLSNIPHGFDFRSLALYVGRENAERNRGNSVEVETYVRNLLTNGNVAIFYKGQRIYTLKGIRLEDHVMSVITLYYDDQNNYAFKYFGHIRW